MTDEFYGASVVLAFCAGFALRSLIQMLFEAWLNSEREED